MDAPFIVKVEEGDTLLARMRFDDKEEANSWAHDQAASYPDDRNIWVTLDVPNKPLRFIRYGDD